MRSSHTYNKENRFFYIWKDLQSRIEKKYGWGKVCRWAIRRPTRSLRFAHLLVAQRARIYELEYRLHIAEYGRKYYMGLRSKNEE